MKSVRVHQCIQPRNWVVQTAWVCSLPARQHFQHKNLKAQPLARRIAFLVPIPGSVNLEIQTSSTNIMWQDVAGQPWNKRSTTHSQHPETTWTYCLYLSLTNRHELHGKGEKFVYLVYSLIFSFVFCHSRPYKPMFCVPICLRVRLFPPWKPILHEIIDKQMQTHHL